MPQIWDANGGMCIDYEIEGPNQYIHLKVYDFDAVFDLTSREPIEGDMLPMYEIFTCGIPTTDVSGHPFDFREELRMGHEMRVAGALDDETFA